MMINIETAAPLIPINAICLCSVIVPLLNVVSMVLSRVSMDTQAAAKEIALEAEYAGLLYLRYLIKLIIARVSVVKVYAAIAIVVTS